MNQIQGDEKRQQISNTVHSFVIPSKIVKVNKKTSTKLHGDGIRNKSVQVSVRFLFLKNIG